MKNNSSQIKDNNQSNFSSVPTYTYNSSDISSPLKDKNLFNKDRLISEPKYSNENIFEKNATKVSNNKNQSYNNRQRNTGLYITEIENLSEMPSNIQRSMTTNENTNISKSLSNKDKSLKYHKKLNLPYIIANIKPNEDLIPISPIFSCCNEENSPKLLNKILYRQQIKEQQNNNKCKTAGNENKMVNEKPKKVAVKDGPKNYISKTREINRLKYTINLKLENIKDFHYDYRQEIKNIDFTINSIRAYKNNLENKFINEYVNQLRALNKITLNERLKEEQQRNEIVRLKKSISNMNFKKKRLELNKFLIEKWIGLQIYIKDKVHIDGKQIKNFIKKNTIRRQSLFQSADEFEDFFKKKEINNLRLIRTLNLKTEEKAVLFKELKKAEANNIADDNYLINMIVEKEKLLKLIKRRNSELLQERKEVKKLSTQLSYDETSPINLELISFTPKKEKDKNKDKEKNSQNIIINYNIIYALIQKTFNYINTQDPSCLTESDDTFRYINTINNPSTKALSQMKIIELAYTFLEYYKMNHIQGNEILYKQLMEEIEQNHKKRKADKYKKEEELKDYEMKKKMEEKKNRIVFKSRKDIYSSLIYIEKIKNKEKKKKKNKKQKLDIFDFLYDVDEDDDKIDNN